MTKKKARKIRYGRLSLLVLLAAGLVFAGGKAASALLRNEEGKEPVSAEVTPSPEETPKTEVTKAKLFMAGDALIHGAVYYCAQQPDGTYDFHEIMAKMEEVSREYDLRYYNQETILGGTELGLSSYPRFNTPQEFGDTMVDYGFNLVSTANNHSLDMDETGILRSKEYWRNQKGVVTAGTYDSPEEQAEIPVYDVNGISYCFLSWTYGCNGLEPPAGKEYLVNVYPGHEEEMLSQVRAAKEKADLVIICMHWGTEYSMEANEEQISLARQLSDAGADIIIGCHPHVIQPVQWINDGRTIVYYSLGNMVSAQDHLARIIGMIGGVTITKTTVGEESTITLSEARADLIYTKYDIIGEHFYHFKVYPFSDLDDSILPGYQDIYKEYSAVINEIDPDILVGGFE